MCPMECDGAHEILSDSSLPVATAKIEEMKGYKVRNMHLITSNDAVVRASGQTLNINTR